MKTIGLMVAAARGSETTHDGVSHTGRRPASDRPGAGRPALPGLAPRPALHSVWVAGVAPPYDGIARCCAPAQVQLGAVGDTGAVHGTAMQAGEL